MFKMLLAILVGASLVWLLVSDFRFRPATPCAVPVTYSFGALDPRFELDADELSAIMHEVEALWWLALERDLIVHDDEGQIIVNLVYDQRQARTNAEREKRQTLDIDSNVQARIEEDRWAAVAQFDAARTAYERELEDFNTRVTRHNDAVDRWNTVGGAPLDEHNELQREQSRLNVQVQQLALQRTEVERLREVANREIDRFNTAVERRNVLIERYNETFGGERRFNQGEYRADGRSREINIYQFSNRVELRTVLAHEVGHALGLDHVDDSSSIMYYLMNEDNVGSSRLSDEDVRAVHALCS